MNKTSADKTRMSDIIVVIEHADGESRFRRNRRTADQIIQDRAHYREMAPLGSVVTVTVRPTH